MNFKHSPLAEYCCFVVVFILSGCASITGSTSYPKEWASIDADITADGCPNVEGTYSNRGTHTFPVELGGPPRLSDVFTRMCRGAGLSSPRGNYQIWPDLPDAISVRILQTPDLLTIHFLGNNGDQTSLQFRRYHFSWSEKRFDDLFTCYASDKEPRLRFFADPESTRSTSRLYIGSTGTLVFLLKEPTGR